jgi:Membrane protein involved in the export of O-antigen and teichoic acid
MTDINKFTVVSSLFWKLMERGGTQGIQFVVQILLARLLLPGDYGLIAIISIFIAIANVIIQNGFSTALIQGKNMGNADFSSVFYLNLLVTAILYTVLFFIAPFIAAFYKNDQFVPLLRTLSIVLFFGALNSIQNAVIARNMQFKKLFFSSLCAIIASGAAGILFAYWGYGVWALVFQQLINQLLITVVLWLIVKWRPQKLFSYQRVKILFSFGWKVLVSSLIDTIYMNLRNLIVGKLFNPDVLGFYNRGDQFPSILLTNIDGSIQAVMFPTLSTSQDNRERVKYMVRRSIVTSSFVLLPVMMGLAVCAKPLVELLLTDKWLPCVPFLQISCLMYALWPVHTANLQAINALGRSDIYLKLEIIKKIMGVAILVITLFYGVYAIAWGGAAASLLSVFINSYPNKKLLGYSYREQLRDIMPSLGLSIAMGTVTYSIYFFNLPSLATLILQATIGILVYLIMAGLLKLECYTYLKTTFKLGIKQKKEVI